jgi:cell division protein FtsQ
VTRRPLFRPRNVKTQVRRQRRRYLVKSLLALSLISGLAFGSYWALTHWDFFSLKKIEIQGGPKTISEAEILKLAQVPPGENLFAIDLAAIHQRLQSYEFFKKISVQRSLPHTLVIQVGEYQPQFLLYTSRFYYVDGDGEIFKDITDSKESRDFPILTGLSEEDLLQRPLWVREVLSQAVGLKTQYFASNFASRFGLSEIHYQKNIGFTLYPEKQKYSIKFGIKDFGEKIQKLTQVLEKLDQAEVQFSSIDLNYPGKVLMTL